MIILPACANLEIMSREQLIKIYPPTELKFKGPFTETRTVVLTLTNMKDAPVCFKVKTTAPKQYCVRPNAGIVEPRSSADVQIMLQPFDYTVAKVSKHKFMVQSMYKPDDFVDSESVWKDCNPANVIDAKLKCTFEEGSADEEKGESAHLAPSATSPETAIKTSSPVKSSSPVITEQPQSSLPITSMTSPGATFYSIEPSMAKEETVKPQIAKEETVKENNEEDEGVSQAHSTSAFNEVVHERNVLQERVTKLESKAKQLEEQNLRQRKLLEAPKPETAPQTTTLTVKQGGFPTPALIIITLIIGLLIGKILF